MNNNQKKINLLNRSFLFIVAGLGNPEKKYNKTRHNAGFLFLDELAEKLNLKWDKNKKFNCQIIKNNNLILIKPLTYMNNSGKAIQAVMSYYKMLPQKFGLKIKNSNISDKLLVIHDDLDILFNKYKFSTNSRSAGNYGVQSIINHLKTKNFQRLRLGIKSELLEHIPAKTFVLKNFNKNEYIKFQKLIKHIIEKHFIIS